MLEQDLPWIDGVVRAKRPERLPVVLTSRPQQCPAAPGRDRLTGFRRPYATAPRPGTGAMTATYATDNTRTFPEYADRARQRLQNSAVRPNSSSEDKGQAEWSAQLIVEDARSTITREMIR